MRKLFNFSLSFFLGIVLICSSIMPTFTILAETIEKYTGVFKYGGFEENTKWTAKNIGGSVNVSLVEGGANNSDRALKIVRTKATANAVTLMTVTKTDALNDFDTSMKHCISLAFKTEGEFTGKIFISLKQSGNSLRFGDSTNGYIIGSISKDGTYESSEWKTLETRGFSMTSDEIEITLSVNGTGTVFFDDFDITIDPDEYNYINNGGFEDGVSGETPTGITVTQDTEITHDSVASAKITSTKTESEAVGNIFLVTKTDRFDPKKAYSLSFSLKTEFAGEGKATISILERGKNKLGENGASWYTYLGCEQFGAVTGTTDWTTYTFTLRNFNEGYIENNNLTLYIFIRGVGTVWADNVIMTDRLSSADTKEGIVTSDTPEGRVEPLTQVSLMTASKASNIWYTVDGSNPTNSNTRMLYNNGSGVVITHDTVIKAYVSTNSNPIGEVSEFRYTCSSLIGDTGFESTAWKTNYSGAAEVDSSQKKSGNSSMRIIGNGEDLYASTGFVSINPYYDYTVSFWIKTENIQNGSVYAGIYLTSPYGVDSFEGQQGLWYYSHYGLCSISSNQDWTKYEFELNDLGRLVYTANIVIGINNGQGRIWVDDVEFNALQKEYYPLTLTSVRMDDELLGSIYSQSTADDFRIEKIITLENKSPVEETGMVIYTVKRDDGSVIGNGSFEANVSPNSKKNYKVDLSTISEYGIFDVEFKMISFSGLSYPLETLKVSRVRNAANRVGNTKLGFSSHAMAGTTLVGDKSPEAIDRYFDMLSLQGITILREEINWNVVETVKGVYRFPEYWPNYLDSAREHGIEIMLIINGITNSVYGDFDYPKTEEQIEAFVNYAEASVEFAVSHGVYTFELQNEVNYIAFIRGEDYSDEYTELLKQVYTRIKTVDNRVKLIAGTLSTADTGFAEKMLKLGAADYMDYFSFHPYTVPYSSESAELVTLIENMRNLFNRYTNKNIHFWITEIGWTTCMTEKGSSSKEQANYLMRTLSAMEALDYVDYMFQYTTHDQGNGYYLEYNWGTTISGGDATNPYAAKQSFVGYSAHNSLLADYKLISTEKNSNGLYIWKYRSVSNGKEMYMLWTDDVSINARITLKTDDAKIYDFYGNMSTINFKTDDVSFVKKISGRPFYIEINYGNAIVDFQIGVLDEEYENNYYINAIDDSSFEEKSWQLADYSVDRWSEFGYSYDDNIAKIDSVSLKGEFSSEKTGASRFFKDVFDWSDKIDYTKTYHIEVSLKGTVDSNVRAAVAISVDNIAIQPFPWFGEFELTSGFWYGENVNIPTEWTDYKTSSFTLEPGTKLTIFPYLRGDAGTVWMDDIRLVPDTETVLTDTGVNITGFELGTVPELSNTEIVQNGTVEYSVDNSVSFVGNKSLKVKFNKEFRDCAYFAFIIPKEITEQLDISTKYHIEVAVKGEQGATTNMLVSAFEPKRTDLNRIRPHNSYGTWKLNGIGSYDINDKFSLATDWGIYTTDSFGITGGELRFQLEIRGDQGSNYWIDNIRLVADRIAPTHGKVTGSFDETTQKYTVTAIANRGYTVSNLNIIGCNEFKPDIAEKTSVTETVYVPYILDETSESVCDVYVIASNGTWSWPTVVAEFVEFDDFYYGDANTDGNVDILDLVKMKKYLARVKNFNYKSIELNNIDFNSNGKITPEDLVILKKLLLYK